MNCSALVLAKVILQLQQQLSFQPFSSEAYLMKISSLTVESYSWVSQSFVYNKERHLKVNVMLSKIKCILQAHFLVCRGTGLPRGKI